MTISPDTAYVAAIENVLAGLRAHATSNRDLGDRFEGLMRAYLRTDPMWADRFNDVWLWPDWPGRGTSPDTGIDLVAAERDGGTCAIQCKLYEHDHTLDKADIDSLFTASGKQQFTSRLIISTTDKWTKHAEGTGPKDDVFHYVYGALHSPTYRERFAGELKRSLARIPYLQSFGRYAEADEQLAQLHLGYESVAPSGLEVVESSGKAPAERYRVTKMRFGKGKDRSTIVYNAPVTLKGIPERAYEYVITGRSAVEWIIDRYQVRTDKDSGIVNDPNAYSSDPRYILDLLQRVVTVSLHTLDIVDGLREAKATTAVSV